MPETNNTQVDIEQAKAKLQEIDQTKESRNDPRAAERTALTRREPPADGPKKDIRPVMAKPKKKRFSQKLKEAMFSEDVGNGSVSDYIFFKILIPSVKRVLSDMANTAINMALGLDPKTRTVGTTHTSNASLYRDRNYSRQAPQGSYGRRNALSEYEWDEATAKDIYEQVCELIEKYGECSIMDAYSIAGLGNLTRTTDRNWGWTSIRDIDVTCVDRMQDRWIVDFPSARPL